MAKFRKKPVVIQAVQYIKGQTTLKEIREGLALNGGELLPLRFGPQHTIIDTPEGTTEVSDGDWIVKGIKGEFYPVKPDIFEETYEVE